MNLRALHSEIEDEIQEAIKEVIASCAFAGGPFVETFEQQFADFCQTDQAVGVGSGTEALWLALLALGVGTGDEVITAPNTFIATAEAISFCGATPVFVDIDEHSYTINPGLIEEAITPRTKAIIPVHLFGQMADMDAIMAIARKHQLYVVEDACQAHGAEYKQQRAGSIGDAGCFSFYPGKNLGAFGEAGAVTTNNPQLAEQIRTLRDHGQQQKNDHQVIGWNGRMDGIQGAVLSVKLKHLPGWNQARRENAGHYNNALAALNEVKIPRGKIHNQHVYHIYSVRVPNRSEFMATLASKDIACGIHYPTPVHVQTAYKGLEKGPGSYPVAENCASQFVSLPMCPSLTREQIDYVAQQINDAYRYAGGEINGNALEGFQPIQC
jgi:dTDP-4-amino-4,6-dideoxygalactose transaminase